MSELVKSDRIKEIHKVFVDGVKIRKPMKVSEWADKYRVLSSQSSSEPGKWRTSRTPYLKEIMDCLSPDIPIRRITIMKGHQVGYTEGILMNFIGYTMSHQPSPTMMVAPTLKQMNKICFQKIEPMITDTPVVREKIATRSKMSSRNTSIHKDFTGGFLTLVGANIAADLSGTSVRNLLLDEVDRMTEDSEGEGSPIELAVGRTAAYSRKKIIMGSTPVDEEFSVVSRWFNDGDQRYYYVPCPHCGHFQTLEISKLSLDKDGVAQYECEKCGTPIKEKHKTLMLARGQWRATSEPVQKSYRSYHLNALYSPVGFLSWNDVMIAKKRADNDEYYAKSFTNLYLGLPTRQAIGDVPVPRVLKSRADELEDKNDLIDSSLICAGADIQKDRIEVLTVAFHLKNMTILHHDVFHGDTNSDDEPWECLRSILDIRNIHLLGVDSGYLPHRVHAWTKEKRDKRIRVVKGAATSTDGVISMSKFMEVSLHDKKIKTGNRYHTVDTGYLKTEIYSRLLIEDEDHPEFIRFPKDLPEEFYEQLCSERKVLANPDNPMDRTSPTKYKWKAIRHRNEILDMIVYSLSMFYLAGGSKAQKNWSAFIARRNARRDG